MGNKDAVGSFCSALYAAVGLLTTFLAIITKLTELGAVPSRQRMSHLLAGDAADNSLYQIPRLQSPHRVPSCGSGGCVACFGRQTQSQASGLLVDADDPCDDHLQRGHDNYFQCHALLLNSI